MEVAREEMSLMVIAFSAGSKVILKLILYNFIIQIYVNSSFYVYIRRRVI